MRVTKLPLASLIAGASLIACSGTIEPVDAPPSAPTSRPAAGPVGLREPRNTEKGPGPLPPASVGGNVPVGTCRVAATGLRAARFGRQFLVNVFGNIDPGFTFPALPADIEVDGYSGSQETLRSSETFVRGFRDGVLDGTKAWFARRNFEAMCSGTPQKKAQCFVQTMKGAAETITSLPVPSARFASAAALAQDALENGLSSDEAFGLAFLSLALEPIVIFGEASQSAADLAKERNLDVASVDRILMARRVARAFWNDVPTDALIASLKRSDITVDALLSVLKADSRFNRRLDEFVVEWLGMNALGQSSKSQEFGPEGSAAAATEARLEALTFIREILSLPRPLSALLTTQRPKAPKSLERLYADTSPGFMRRGILGMAAIYMTYTFPEKSAPFKRASFVLNRFMCINMKVPDDVTSVKLAPESPTVHPHERFKVLLTAPSCAECHSILNPLGFALDVFDPAGRYRSTLNGFPLAMAGSIPIDGTTRPFANTDELATLLAAAADYSPCVVSHLASKLLDARVEAPACLSGLPDPSTTGEGAFKGILASILQEAR